MFLVTRNYARVYLSLEQAHDEIGPVDFIDSGELFSVDGTRFSHTRVGGRLRLEATEERHPKRLVARLRQVMTDSELPMPDDHADDPRRWVELIRELNARDAEDVQRAMEPGLRDLNLTHPDLLTVDPIASGLMLRDSTGSGSGIVYWSIRGGGSFAVYWAADAIAEAAIEALWGERKNPVWPVCPDHPGGAPLSAEVVDDSAVWVCLDSKRIISAIGNLAAQSADQAST